MCVLYVNTMRLYYICQRIHEVLENRMVSTKCAHDQQAVSCYNKADGLRRRLRTPSATHPSFYFLRCRDFLS